MTKRDFILRAKASGSVLTVPQLATAYDALIVAMPADPAPPAVDQAPVLESNKVDAWLAGLSKTDATSFAALRVKTFADIRAAWIAAGSP